MVKFPSFQKQPVRQPIPQPAPLPTAVLGEAPVVEPIIADKVEPVQTQPKESENELQLILNDMHSSIQSVIKRVADIETVLIKFMAN